MSKLGRRKGLAGIENEGNSFGDVVGRLDGIQAQVGKQGDAKLGLAASTSVNQGQMGASRNKSLHRHQTGIHSIAVEY